MTQAYDPKVIEKDFSDIGYYGRPITVLSRKELLVAFAELVDVCKAYEDKNKACKEVLKDAKFELCDVRF